MATPDKLLTDCHWFYHSQCTKGAACEYRHYEGAKANTSTCRQWSNGNKCTNKECKYRHPSTSTVPCYYMLNGGCMKGDSCPYSHAMMDPTLKMQEELKRKNEEELRKLQEERKKEEQRLAQLRAQSQDTSSDKPGSKERSKPPIATRLGPNAQDDKSPKKASDAPAQPFLKTVKQLQTQDTATQKKGKDKKQRDKSTKATPSASKQPSGKPDFGIKTLEELRKEKELQNKSPTTAATTPTPAPASTTATPTPVSTAPTTQETVSPATQTKLEASNKKAMDLEALRKKNEQKFKTAQPVSPQVDKPESKETPKRKGSDLQVTEPVTSPVENVQKRAKPDTPQQPAPQQSTPQQTQSTTTIKKVDSQADILEDFDLDNENIDIGGDIDDKEFDDLLQ